MELRELKSVTNQAARQLEADEWTVEKLATANAKDLTGYKGIGKATAEKIIAEAMQYLNSAKLTEAERLERERYLAKAPLRKIVQDLVEEGFSIEILALLPISNLDGYKLIDRQLAARIISFAQDEMNRQKLYESRVLAAETTQAQAQAARSPAFPEAWLSGEVKPQQMSVRVKRIFEAAKTAYEAEQ